jgi:hypothetical protein
MHTLKLILLMAVTLSLMRAFSWALLWLAMRFCSCRIRTVSILSNAGALLAFLGLLHWNRLPGEFLDYSAAIFGLVVYAIFAMIDLVWLPWCRGSLCKTDNGKA